MGEEIKGEIKLRRGRRHKENMRNKRKKGKE
jgi:hypothetical protein